MALTQDDVSRIAKLARLQLSGDEQAALLPQLNGFAREARQAVRGFDHAVTDFNARPQSVLFGPAPGAPGPGETGFTAPAARAARAPHPAG